MIPLRKEVHIKNLNKFEKERERKRKKRLLILISIARRKIIKSIEEKIAEMQQR
jgi:hypothetical protein